MLCHERVRGLILTSLTFLIFLPLSVTSSSRIIVSFVSFRILRFPFSPIKARSLGDNL